MKYVDLAEIVAELSGKTPEDVKDVFFALPAALENLREGDTVRTPIGSFRAFRRKMREVPMPDGKKMATIKDLIIVKLKPGPRLRRG